MRNLKKVLSLALALVMLLGMMVMGAGAAEYRDAANIDDDYKEAIGVVSAINVMNGRTTSSFQPEGTLTRAEAATIITRSLLGRTVADALAKNTESRFSDMQGHWAAGAVEYCYDRGIVRGTTTTTFSPGRPVKSVEFTAMVLRALGLVDADNAAGGNWQTEAIAVAAKNKVSESVVVSSAPMKRQEAAQMSFNAITKYSPSGTSGYKVEGGDPKTDVVFSTATEALLFISTQTDKGTIKASVSDDSLAKTVHNLTPDTKDDGFGHKINTWKVDGKEVWAASTYTSNAAKTFTYTKATANKDFKDADFASSVDLIVDGEPQNAITADYANKVAKKTNNSAVVELYKNSAGKYNKVIVVNTYAGLVTVNEAKKETARSINIKGVSDLNKLETEDWEKDQVVLYNKSYVSGKDTVTYNIKNVAAAGSVTGTLTRVSKGDETFTVSGTAYGFSSQPVKGTSAADVKSSFLGVADQIFYLDAAGKNIVYATAADGQTAAIKDYAMILAADVVRTSAFGTDTLTMKVKALLSDGTFGTYKVDLKKAAKAIDASGNQPAVAAGDWTVKIGDITKTVVTKANAEDARKTNKNLTDEAFGVLDETVYTYTLSGDTMTLKGMLGNVNTNTPGSYAEAIATYSGTDTKTVITKNSTTVRSNSHGEVILNNNTVYVLYQENKTPAVVTGAANLGATKIDADVGHTAYIVVEVGSNKLPVVTCVFSTGVAPEAADTGDYVYVNGTYSIGKDVNGTEVYYYTGITPDGDEIEVTADDGSKAAGIYTYNTEKKLGNAPDTAASGIVTVVSGTTVGIKGGENPTTYLTTNADTKIVSVDDRTDLEENAQVFYVAKNGVIVTAYTKAKS